MSQPANTAARRIVETLVMNGIDRVFCVPGESYLAVLDALADVRDRIQVITCRQVERWHPRVTTCSTFTSGINPFRLTK